MYISDIFYYIIQVWKLENDLIFGLSLDALFSFYNSPHFLRLGKCRFFSLILLCSFVLSSYFFLSQFNLQLRWNLLFSFLKVPIKIWFTTSFFHCSFSNVFDQNEVRLSFNRLVVDLAAQNCFIEALILSLVSSRRETNSALLIVV